MSDEEIFGEDNDGLDAFQAYFSERDRAFEAVLNAINSDYNCDLHMTCEACPVQIEGSIDELYLYFRARWDSWRLAIAQTSELAVWASRMADAVFYHQACTFDGSWMEPAQVDKALRTCLTAYRNGEKNGGYIEL
jgi:hypothetical protein